MHVTTTKAVRVSLPPDAVRREAFAEASPAPARVPPRAAPMHAPNGASSVDGPRRCAGGDALARADCAAIPGPRPEWSWGTRGVGVGVSGCRPRCWCWTADGGRHR
ncbi:hypothetical protein EAO73_28095 [Streptomyces sp. col6]|nr:hypothetical protein EAO73_28095 [Streptomyces sp. col6]